MGSMRRPPSYSDSYVILNSGSPRIDLAPLSINTPQLTEDTIGFSPPPLASASVWPRRISLFILKSSLHCFLISVFETAFFFLYVSRTENSGILKTIDTYYQPVVADCRQWGNLTRWALYEILTHEISVPGVDAAATAAASGRAIYNSSLLHLSMGVSGGFLGLCALVISGLLCKRMKVSWTGVLFENCMMVLFLGLYEYFFFRVVIYNYDTISTPELNAYIVDGLWSCANP
jgi:hypothetical protein